MLFNPGSRDRTSSRLTARRARRRARVESLERRLVLDAVISEILFNSSATGGQSEEDWEWIEVFNSGPDELDLTGWVLDDDDSAILTGSNIAGGTIPVGERAVLFNANNAADFEATWETPVNPTINLIPVTDWSALANGGENIGLWDSFASYNNRDITQAVDSVDYGAGGFPTEGDGQSIYLTDTTLDNTDGANWAVSTGFTPDDYTVTIVGGTQDTGSPGLPGLEDVDLAVDVAESVDPVTAGSGVGNLTYTVTVTNNSGNDAPGVVVETVITIPSDVTIDSNTPSQGTVDDTNAPTFEWAVGTIPAFGSVTLDFTLTVGAAALDGTQVTTSAAVTSVTANDTDATNDADSETTTISSAVQGVDLAIDKIESADPVQAGSGPSNLAYIVTLVNNGDTEATNVEVSEALTLPPGATLVSANSTSGTVSGLAPNLTWSLDSLQPEESQSLTIVITVGAGAADGSTIVNNASVVSDQVDADPSDNTVTETTSIVNQTTPTIDLSLTKTDSADPVVAGAGPGNLVYTLTVTNAGPDTATNVTVTDTLTLPAGVDPPLDSAVNASQGVITLGFGGRSFSWDVGTLASGETANVTVTLTVDSNAAAGAAAIRNEAQVFADQADSDNSNNTVVESTDVAREVDIALTKAESADPVVAGSGTGNLTHILTVANNGPSDATNVVIEDVLTLPAGVTLESATPSAGMFVGTTFTLPSLAAGATETLTVVLTVGDTASDGDLIVNTATLASVDETDTNSANDAASERTSISVEQVDLAVSKSDSADPVQAGSGSSNLVYFIQVTNNSATDATGVVVEEQLTLPSGVTVVATNPSQGGVSGTSPTFTWTVGDISAGATETLTVVLTVDASTAGGTDVISNTATVTAVDQIDTDASNDAASESTSVTGVSADPVDLAITKFESSDPVVAGSGPANLVYVVTVTNESSNPASGVVVEEDLDLPSGVSLLSINSTQGIIAEVVAGDTFDWNVGSLPGGASAALTIVLTVDETAAPGTDVVGDTATITALDQMDADLSNNSVTEFTTIDAPPSNVDLQVVKTISADPVIAGEPFTFEVTVTNLGTTEATDVVVTDDLDLPEGYGFDFVGVVPGTAFFGTDVTPEVEWELGSLQPGASETLTFEITTPRDAVDGAVLSNSATVTSNEPDADSSNNSDSISATLSREVDLAVTKTGPSDAGLAALAGEAIYTITVTNNGPSDASGVEVSDITGLPAGLSIDSFVVDGPFETFDPDTQVLTIGDLPAGETTTLTLTITGDPADFSGEFTNTVEVTGVNETDTNAANDSASVTVDFDGLTPGITTANDPANPGQQIVTLVGDDSRNDFDVWESGERLYARLDGQTQIFTASNVSAIRIYGQGGDDDASVASSVEVDALISGGDGDDRLFGGSGDDHLLGGEGNDRLYGNDGDDTLEGEAGNDRLYGHDGFDRLFGNGGDDDLYGGDDDDRLFGGSGNDRLFADRGDDLLVGEAGVDFLDGNNGNDVLIGGDEADELDGDDGEDLLVGGATDYDNDLALLDEIYGFWTNTGGSAANRSANLQAGVGVIPLSAAEITDDGSVDELVGDSDDDLLFAGNEDEIRNARGDEIVNV